MTDLEMTKLCAEAMGFSYTDFHLPRVILTGSDAGEEYNPLHDDAQAMALVKKFGLHPLPEWDEGAAWTVFGGGCNAVSDDLNRAIVECVAKMQASKIAAT